MLDVGDIDLGRFIEPVARAIYGDPNPHLSSKTDLRFGSHGSMHVDVTKGTAYSHEEKIGGGVLWLVEREKKLSGAAAFAFLREIGCDIPRPEHAARADAKPAPLGKVVASYDYVDENGLLLFQVARFEPKTFRQRVPDETERSGWSYKVRGVRQVPYRLPALLEAIAEDRPVFIVEGEKDVDNLAKWNVPATCNAGGAGKWPDDLTAWFEGADVVIIPDNDPQAKREDGSLVFYAPDHAEFPNEPAHPGQDHAEMVARRLNGVARRVRILALPGLPPKGDVTDWINYGGTPNEFYHLVAAAQDWQRRNPAFVSRFGAQRWEDIGSPQASIGYTWFVEDIFPMGEIVLAYGDSGSGKTFDMFDAAMAGARNIKWNGRNVEHGLVVYVAAEAGKGFVKRKIAYAMQHGLEPSDPLPFVLLTKRPNFFHDDTDILALIQEIKAICRMYSLPLVCIVIDTLSAAAPGMNENASQDVSMVRKRLVLLQETFSACIVLVHHKPKNGTTPRGHGSLTADFETTIEFETVVDKKTDTGKTIHRGTVRKQREGKSGISWEFTLPVVEVGTNKWGNPETSCVVLPYNVGATKAASVGFHATPTEKMFMRALYDAMIDHAVPAPVGLPKSITKVVEQVHVRTLMRDRTIAAHENYDQANNRFRVAFKRAGDKLRDGGVIGVQGNLLWPTGKPVAGFSEQA